MYILTWKCASRHNGVQFFISHLASWLCTRRFSEPTFRPSRATNHWKNTVNRDFPTFSRICIFFLLIFSLLTLLTSAFQLSILSEVSLLNFLRQCPANKIRLPQCLSYDIVFCSLYPQFCSIVAECQFLIVKSPSKSSYVLPTSPFSIL